MEHLFKLPIGDWSDDGHGECSYYTIKSNKSVEEVREIHFKIKDSLGIDIESIASEYEDSSIDSDIVEKLFEMGFKEFLGTRYGVCLECENEEDEEYDSEWTITSEGMAYLWLFLLMKADSSLKLEFDKTVKIPMLPFYGFDEKNRHISFVGYGCF